MMLGHHQDPCDMSHSTDQWSSCAWGVVGVRPQLHSAKQQIWLSLPKTAKQEPKVWISCLNWAGLCFLGCIFGRMGERGRSRQPMKRSGQLEAELWKSKHLPCPLHIFFFLQHITNSICALTAHHRLLRQCPCPSRVHFFPTILLCFTTVLDLKSIWS